MFFHRDTFNDPNFYFYFFQGSENQTTNAESYFGQRNNPEPDKNKKISHQEVQDRVNKILAKLAHRDSEAKSKKKRSENCSTNSTNSVTTPTESEGMYICVESQLFMKGPKM